MNTSFGLFESTSTGITSAQASKLAGIETAADVTDAANVEAAGAVMEGDIPNSIYMGGTGTLTAGKLHYLAAGGAWTETDATDTTAGAEGLLLGISVGTDPATDGMLVSGITVASTYLDGHTPGMAVYMSETAGRMTTTQPSTAGNALRIVAFCTNTANEIYFRPDGIWGTK